MSDKTGIEWTDATWNPTTGCDRISVGCDNCYALTLAKRLKGMGSAKYQNDGDPRTSGPGFALTVHPDALRIPYGWRAPRRVFVNSMSDLFHAKVPMDFVLEVFAVMADTPQHTYQVLTKRPSRVAHLAPKLRFPPNVWIGTSVENASVLHRVDSLRQVPAAVRFLSCEPLLGSLDGINLDGIRWVIAGGESGPGARPMHPDWVRALRDQCVGEGVPFLLKQWGAWVGHAMGGDPWGNGRSPWADRDVDAYISPIDGKPSEVTGHGMWRVGKKAAGRELDGRTWDEYPEVAHA